MEIKRYINLPKCEGGAEPVVSYVLDSLLQSRIATGHESNTDTYDEDVNVYLALLLSSLVDSRYLSWSSQFVTAYESDIFERLQYTQDTYVKFLTYKVNADYLLLTQGIFEVPASIYSTAESRGRDSIQRGKAYYQIAGTLTRQLHDDRRALADVLQKLSDGYEKYLVVLSYMRGEYFNIVKEISPGELFHLTRDIDSIAMTETLRQKRDAFLDLYNSWKKSLGTPDERAWEAKVTEAAQELTHLDPSFRSPFSKPTSS
jgi:hypothetical protein